MATQTNIPPGITDADKAIIFQTLDHDLGSALLNSLLQGLYTGIVAVTLWNIYTHKSRPIGQVMIIIIMLLYIATMVTFMIRWTEASSQYVRNGQNFWTKFLCYSTSNATVIIGGGVSAAISTILADSAIIWRCWIVWGRRWLSILLPVLLLVSTVVFKLIATYQLYVSKSDYPLYFTLYSSFTLATTLWCTFLIIYRIVTIARAAGEAGGGLRAYRHVLEVLVESSALYSVFLILCTAFFARNSIILGYFDVLAGIARGIAPTLLVGRVAAGHARPDDSWQGSAISGSLHFRSHAGDQNSSNDLETQLERGDEYIHLA
ncbi:hypothetical protein EDD18DRAFT_440968 [Armillaria luteobubalina]|uniref:Uncharacterized protein n=1 Tax=Armillaria luteobubalina TaxID=153913 RepID=A0AA39PPV5_9AGAR|nr:hypothetical protein EDD18DRAFT_594013 [Armillaria luteobubalina]KAK0492910.1 hypothetical protein EDD18DRAFT_440968 [Armillaria luteobubalina]